MVQVENEYGAYASDKSYIVSIRDIVKKSGFTDVPLFQCDWSSNFQNNGLDDLLWTINFGTGANNPAYSAMCSSYDYDAPISEAGWATPKYHLLRDLLKNYIQEGETLTDIPATIPLIEIPEITFTESALIFDNLPSPQHSDEIKPMEKFGQGWGSILYRTTLLQRVENGTTLQIDEVHDWAQVFANGKLLGRLDRRWGEFALTLPELKTGTRLDILVEAMGRVNFGRSIHDRKGITKSVKLYKGNEIKDLKRWEVYNLPVDYTFAKNKKHRTIQPVGAPSYYKATFDLKRTGDTFLDMSTWGKGMVWVNGHAMGRFWEIGPQQTLFMPGCWLKKGKNEIIVLDLKGPAKAVVKGIKVPILDMMREKKNFHS